MGARGPSPASPPPPPLGRALTNNQGSPCFPLQDVVQEPLQVLPGGRRHFLRWPRCVHDGDALRLSLRKLQEAGSYPLVELQRFAADAVGEQFVVLASEAGLRRDV